MDSLNIYQDNYMASILKYLLTVMRKAAQEIGKTIYIGAVMSESAPQGMVDTYSY